MSSNGNLYHRQHMIFVAHLYELEIDWLAIWQTMLQIRILLAQLRWLKGQVQLHKLLCCLSLFQRWMGISNLSSAGLQLDTSTDCPSRLLATKTFEEIDMKTNLDTKPSKLSHQVFLANQIDMISVLRNPKILVRYLISFADAFLTSTNAELKRRHFRVTKW